MADTLIDLKNSAQQLDVVDQAELAVFLIERLENTHHWVNDAEVDRRAAQLESGEVKGLTHLEFLEACGRR